MMITDKAFKFDKSQRLLTPKDFQAMSSRPMKVSQDPAKSPIIFKIHQPNLLLFVKLTPAEMNNAAVTNRLGLAITKKKVKRAHERNRIKRLTREYFRLHQHQLKRQVDILLTVKSFSDEMPNEEIVKQLALAFILINDKIRKLTHS